MVMLLDTSGSMANQVDGYQKIHLALEGVRSAVMAMDKTDQVSIIGFAEKIQHDIPLTTDYSSVIRALGQFQPSGGTQMLPALEQAYLRLQAASTKEKHLRSTKFAFDYRHWRCGGNLSEKLSDRWTG